VTRRRAIHFAILLLAACGDSTAGPRHALQWKLAPGDVFQVELKQRQTGDASPDAPHNPPRSIESRIEATYELRVLAEIGPGEYSLELVPVRLAITGDVGAIQMEVEFRDGRWVKESFQGEVGMVDPKQVLAKYKQALVQPVPGRARSYAFKHAGSEEAALMSGLYRVFPALPRDPIPVDSSWFEEAPLGTFANTTGLGMAQMRNTLSAFETVQGADLATIETSVDRTMAEQGKTFRAQRTRSATFDASDGCYRSVSDDFTLTGGGWNMRVLADVRLSRIRK
jgi:hypothetical protein